MEAEIFKQLEELKKLITQQQLLQKEALTFSEAAQYLTLSESYLYQMVSRGQIPAYRPGGKRLIFSRRELDQWLLSNKQRSKSEIVNEVEEFFINRKRA